MLHTPAATACPEPLALESVTSPPSPDGGFFLSQSGLSGASLHNLRAPHLPGWMQSGVCVGIALRRFNLCNRQQCRVQREQDRGVAIGEITRGNQDAKGRKRRGRRFGPFEH